MKRRILTLSFVLAILTIPVAAQEVEHAADGLVAHVAAGSVSETLERTRRAIEARGLAVMDVIDHAAAAADVGQELTPITLILFGNPEIGSRVMACAPTIGIDLPQKILIWASDGVVRLGYNDVFYLAERHGIDGCVEVLSRVRRVLEQVAREGASG